ncbi:MAG: deoxyribodipyrimidine photolyase [Polyangiales bacterium]
MGSVEKSVPAIRLRALNDRATRVDGGFVLYWMIAARRPFYNFALQHAVELAQQLNKPLLVFEPLRIDYGWASDRFHRFVLDGMRANKTYFESKNVAYFPYVESEKAAAKGLLQTLASHACAVVTDDFPAFFLPQMLDAAAQKLSVATVAVDSNGLLPVRASDRAYARAVDFRRYLQKVLPTHLDHFPKREPLEGLSLLRFSALDSEISGRWEVADDRVLSGRTIAELPIDHRVGIAALEGGFVASSSRCTDFVENTMHHYADSRNHPDDSTSSGISPWLHFGHLSAFEVFTEIAEVEGWERGMQQTRANGAREGWWSMGVSAEAYLDQLITWRELGFNMCAHRRDYDQYDSLPPWALQTLKKHERDRRPYLYTLEQFDEAATHDPLWNAAQRQLRITGTMHNYLRMLWGKKILHWSETPRDAVQIMIELNNKYAIDGRDPNSYSGIFWVLGRYDRPWGPERDVFGTVRYMTSDSTMKKLRLKRYLSEFGEQATLF